MSDWIPAGTLQELERAGVLTIRGADRQIAVFWNDGDPRAVDNRCPHMGFPLDKGTVADGILTCHWHHARFALKGGCAFDLFADDVPAFLIRVQGERVEVASEPASPSDADAARARLRRGLQQNLPLIQAKSIVALRSQGVNMPEILRELAAFGSENHDAWRNGMTLLALVGRLDPVLREKTRLHGLAWAASALAENCDGQPRRRERGPLEGADEPLERLQGWFRKFVTTRQRDGAERALLTASARCQTSADRLRTLAGGILQRVYVNTGHLFDFANKALELGDILDADARDLWPQILPLLAKEAAEGQGEEDQGAWRAPVDLIPMIREAEAALTDLHPGSGSPPDGLGSVLLGDDPRAILSRLVEALRGGADPVALAHAVARAAAWRMARFSPANDLADWFDPLHSFTYANAVVQSLKRAPAPELLPALLHGALAVFQDRFLNVPPSSYPESSEDPSDCALDDLLELLNNAPQPSEAVAKVVAFVLRGGDLAQLTERLAWAVIREDLDFHKLQAVEAAYQLSQDTDDRETQALLFAAATRYLAAHCPTPRARLKTTRTAISLHRS